MAEIKSSNKSSKEDNDIYKIRYAYMPERKSPNSRQFCSRNGNIYWKKYSI